MKNYTLDSHFTFGKYEGQTLQEVIINDPSYIEWCIINLDHFFLTTNTIEEIQRMTPTFSLSSGAEEKRNVREEEMESRIQDAKDQNNIDFFNDYDPFDGDDSAWFHYNQ